MTTVKIRIVNEEVQMSKIALLTNLWELTLRKPPVIII